MLRAKYGLLRPTRQTADAKGVGSGAWGGWLGETSVSGMGLHQLPPPRQKPNINGSPQSEGMPAEQEHDLTPATNGARGARGTRAIP